MRLPPATYILLLLCLCSLPVLAQNFLPLNFSQSVQGTNAIYPNLSTLGPNYYSGQTYDFLNVTSQNGQAVDARVNIIGTSGNYNFVGWIPNYNSASGQPEADLGVYYRHDGLFDPPDPENPDAERFSFGGITFTISFFEGGGTFLNSTVLSEVGFMIYDHDGEANQSESIRTYQADGFSGYRIYNGSGIQATGDNGTWTFDAAGYGASETTPEASFIAYYQNSSSIRFDMFSTTSSLNPVGSNGIFAGIDGDLSLTDGQTTGFGAYVAVPEPTSPMLIASALSLILLRRRRSKC
ncbi:MAG: PEP-CTERM sorting domain-containing protein [Gloeobacteraceae cyanobacterium ES-bin-144]|nr:PEP-CTERM sorting domain-containing protein [Verrucomicrobiales bacterium]